MGAAFVAGDFGAPHHEAMVVLGGDVFFRHRRPEARPAGAGVKLGIGAEQLVAAAGAAVHAFVVMVPILAGKSALGALLPADLKLLVGQLLAPLLFGFFYFFHIALLAVRAAVQRCMLMNCSGIGSGLARSN